MSLRREVVSLSQLLRRHDSSAGRQHRQTAHGPPPPLALQSSRQRLTKPRLADQGLQIGDSRPPIISSTPFTDKPRSFIQSIRDAASASQPESLRSSSVFAPMSQEGDGYISLIHTFETESEQLSALTSMSQSSVSQFQSQNLLGSSQEGDQLWRAPELLPTALPLPPATCCIQLQELEKSISKVLSQQMLDQKQQQQQLLTDFVSPLSSSVDDIQKKLVLCTEAQHKHDAAVAELAAGVNNVTATVSALREQSCSNSTAVCEEIRTAVMNETAGVKAVLTSLQARFETVEDSVKSCSGLVAQVREDAGTKHDALLSAVAASACSCTQEVTPVEAPVSAERPSKKRKRSVEARETDSRSYTLASLLCSPLCQSPVQYRDDDDDEVWRDKEASGMQCTSLQGALQQIEALRARRRSILRIW